MRLVTDAIARYKVRSIFFTGGEPSLYIRKINRILGGVDQARRLNVTVTTNGWFATTPKRTVDKLMSFSKLDSVQLSYDKFHKKFLPEGNVLNLFEACKKLKKRFSVVMSVQSPLDLQLVGPLKKIGKFTIGIQHVLPLGAAKTNGLGYKRQSFDKQVLFERCPVRGKIAYMPGYGFSACCIAPEIAGRGKPYFYPTPEKLLESRFYNLVSRHTFKEIGKKLNISEADISGENSSPCMVCAEMFAKAGRLK
ncbi:MAG: hypothetical protein A2X29_04635 [Elusimicrobia bacterium GWA2_64_40]|nr:MAG: hypothetical protein A2X29_04635 [Elusimicrobia bacterium GWA2_64_40]OGR65818.1 MAG: hypothetical protein A2X30_10165 [Elusimicrobia bacterium GWB2_63_16]